MFFKMQEFRLLDYYTEYSCKGSFNKKMSGNACFSYVFNNVTSRSNETYKVVLYKGITFAKERHKSNACLFTKKELKRHLQQAQAIYPFTFRIEEKKDWNGYKVFIVILDIKKVPGTFHKYILTWLRYMYEFPYNVILLDAYKLKKERSYKFTSMSDMFNIVLSHFCAPPRDIHQIAKNVTSKRLRKSRIREKIKKVYSLNEIYTELKCMGCTIPKKINNFSYHDIEYWSQENFDEVRKPIYMSR